MKDFGYPSVAVPEPNASNGGGGMAIVERLIPPNIWMWDLGADGITFHVPVAPNRIHRLMQRVVLGIRWRRSN